MHDAIDQTFTNLATPAKHRAERHARALPRRVGQRLALVPAAALLLAGSQAHAAPPANDSFTNATVVGPLPYTEIVDISEANPDPEASGCAGHDTVWREFTAPETDITFEPLEPLAVEVTLDPTGMVNVQTGAATVTGTVECTQDTDVDITIDLKQKVKGGQDALTASGDVSVGCGESFSLTLETSGGFFKAGKVVASGTFFACDLFGDCVSDSIETQVIQLSNKKK